MALFGRTIPRVYTKPLRELTPETSRGFEFIWFCEQVVGVHLLPWQKWLAIHMLELLPDGSYRFRRVLVEVARQNGKTTFAALFVLWRLYADKSRLALGTAQNLEASEETWSEALEIAEGTPELARELRRIRRQNGRKEMTLASGARYKVAPSDENAARGKPADTILLDELRTHKRWDAWNAVSSTSLAQSNGILLAISNAGDVTSVVMKHLHDTGVSSVDDRDTPNGFFWWTAPDDAPIDDPATWAEANPSYGYTITEKAMRSELEKSEAGFRTENLCQWVERVVPSYIGLDEWKACADPASRIADDSRLTVGVDVSADRAYTSIAVAGFDEDERACVEVITRRAGMLWVEGYLTQLCKAQPVESVLVQARGCAASELAPVLQAAQLPVRLVQGTMLGGGTGQMYDHVREGRLRHRDQPILNIAVAGGYTKRMGDSQAWDRQASAGVDIAPLVACSWALFGLMNDERADMQLSAYREMGNWWEQSPPQPAQQEQQELEPGDSEASAVSVTPAQAANWWDY